ncbi:hypothetical protein [uncultured Thiohalocapsa sp.]|uniref:hypothetical protein n=1 Tax=uncultured Thiohalocapsa sp. TaxID=768990 RepID=UPI0025E0BCF3|nr:hypothetical protein [uncultured Thiohalocapsa sp.]
MQLDQLLAARADLWRGHATPQAAPPGLATGFRALDPVLSGQGWPAAGLSEVLSAHQGAGLALLLPLLAALSRPPQQQMPRWILWVDPPHIPFAPALAARGLDLRRILIVHAGADAAWAAEQGLRSGTCAAVLAWTGLDTAQVNGAAAGGRREQVAARTGGGADRQRNNCWTPAALRRLQLAAAETQTPALLLRPLAVAAETSPAALRLRVSACAEGLDVTLLKQRGGRPGQRLRLPAQPDAEGFGGACSHADGSHGGGSDVVGWGTATGHAIATSGRTPEPDAVPTPAVGAGSRSQPDPQPATTDAADGPKPHAKPTEHTAPPSPGQRPSRPPTPGATAPQPARAQPTFPQPTFPQPPAPARQQRLHRVQAAGGTAPAAAIRRSRRRRGGPRG